MKKQELINNIEDHIKTLKRYDTLLCQRYDTLFRHLDRYDSSAGLRRHMKRFMLKTHSHLQDKREKRIFATMLSLEEKGLWLKPEVSMDLDTQYSIADNVTKQEYKLMIKFGDVDKMIDKAYPDRKPNFYNIRRNFRDELKKRRII